MVLTDGEISSTSFHSAEFRQEFICFDNASNLPWKAVSVKYLLFVGFEDQNSRNELLSKMFQQ